MVVFNSKTALEIKSAAIKSDLKHLLGETWLQQTPPTHFLNTVKATVKVWNSVVKLCQGPSQQTLHSLQLRSLELLIPETFLADLDHAGIHNILQLFPAMVYSPSRSSAPNTSWKLPPSWSIFKQDTLFKRSFHSHRRHLEKIPLPDRHPFKPPTVNLICLYFTHLRPLYAESSLSDLLGMSIQVFSWSQQMAHSLMAFS